MNVLPRTQQPCSASSSTHPCCPSRHRQYPAAPGVKQPNSKRQAGSGAERVNVLPRVEEPLCAAAVARLWLLLLLLLSTQRGEGEGARGLDTVLVYPAARADGRRLPARHWHRGGVCASRWVGSRSAHASAKARGSRRTALYSCFADNVPQSFCRSGPLAPFYSKRGRSQAPRCGVPRLRPNVRARPGPP